MKRILATFVAALVAVAASAAVTITTSAKTFQKAGGAASVVVQGDGSWTATSDSDWIVIRSGASGNGAGSCVYVVNANATAGVRIGHIDIGGNTYTITQDGYDATISPTSARTVLRKQQRKGTDPVKVAEQLMEALKGEQRDDADTVARIYLGATKAQQMSDVEKQRFLSIVRDSMIKEHHFIPDVADIISIKPIGPNDKVDGRLFTESLSESERRDMESGEAAYVVVFFKWALTEDGPLNDGMIPLGFGRDENGDWSISGLIEKARTEYVAKKGSKQREEAVKWNWERRCAEKWGDSFKDVQEAFRQFGGFRLLQPPMEGVEFDEVSSFDGDFQRDVPLPGKYRFFETADLCYAHGALVSFVLKVQFEDKISLEAVDKELERVKVDVARRMATLDAKAKSALRPVEQRIEYKSGNESGFPEHIRVGTSYEDDWDIFVSFKRDGRVLTLSVNTTDGIDRLMREVIQRGKYEEGEPLPELDEDMGGNLPELPEDGGVSSPKENERAASPLPGGKDDADREILPGFESLVEAMAAVVEDPTYDHVTSMVKAWRGLPPDQKTSLQDSIVSASCAAYLSNGNDAAAASGIKLLDKAAFMESVSDVCHSCDGSGRSTASKNGRLTVTCEDCGGRGRVVSKDKCREVFERNMAVALRICLGEE